MMHAGEVAKDAGTELGSLLRNELALAREELRGNIRDAETAAFVATSAAACTIVGAELVVGAVVAAGRGHPVALALIGAGLLGVGAFLGSTAWRAMPPVLERTRQRAREDTDTIQEALG